MYAGINRCCIDDDIDSLWFAEQDWYCPDIPFMLSVMDGTDEKAGVLFNNNGHHTDNRINRVSFVR